MIGDRFTSRPPGRGRAWKAALVLASASAWASVGIALAGGGPPDEKGAKAPGKLAMSPAVAVSRVDGLEDYVPLDGAKLTSEDKLKVYFRPLNYKVEATEAGFRVAFTEDGRVRRKGEKVPLSKEDKLLESEQRYREPDYRVYLVNTIGLKSLKPGDYEFDIILHDALEPGSEATQTLPFTVIEGPRPAPEAKGGGPAAPEGPAGPREKAKAKGKSKSGRPKMPPG